MVRFRPWPPFSSRSSHLAVYGCTHGGYSICRLPIALDEVFTNGWALVRRKFYDIHTAQTSPIAAEALARIARLYALEADIRGRPPDERCAVHQAPDWPRAAFIAYEAACHGCERIEEKRAGACHSLRAVALGRTDSLMR
jgi:hypothetical protein